MKNQFNVTVNESFSIDLIENDIKDLDIISLGNNKYHLLQNNQSQIVEIIEKDFFNKSYTIRVNNKKFTIKISGSLENLISEMGFSLSTSSKEGNIKAPMPGLILELSKKEGDKINEGEQILILEAMKMENTICSSKDGIISKIHVQKGQTVEKGILLVEIE